MLSETADAKAFMGLTTLVGHLSGGNLHAARMELADTPNEQNVCLFVLTSAFLGEDATLEAELDMLGVAKVNSNDQLASVEAAEIKANKSGKCVGVCWVGDRIDKGKRHRVMSPTHHKSPMLTTFIRLYLRRAPQMPGCCL